MWMGSTRSGSCSCSWWKIFSWFSSSLVMRRSHISLPSIVGKTISTLGRPVQLPQIAPRALPRTICRAHRLDQRPVAVLSAVSNAPVLAKEHLVPTMAAENFGSKWVGLHYNRFSEVFDSLLLKRNNFAHKMGTKVENLAASLTKLG